MSTLQRCLLSLGLLSAALMLVYPPWLKMVMRVPGPDAEHLHPMATTTVGAWLCGAWSVHAVPAGAILSVVLGT
jgi:hypothetical protein